MKRKLWAVLAAGAALAGCCVAAFGYWVDSIQVGAEVTLFYPVSLAVLEPEKEPLPLPEGALPEEAASGEVPEKTLPAGNGETNGEADGEADGESAPSREIPDPVEPAGSDAGGSVPPDAGESAPTDAPAVPGEAAPPAAPGGGADGGGSAG